MFPREREGFDRPRFIMSPVPPCGKQSPVVPNLACFQWLVNLLEAASTLGTAAALHWLGVRKTEAACAVVCVSNQVEQQSEYCEQERRARG